MIKHSLIIPTAGRPIEIEVAIKSVLSNNLMQYFAELIIVDNNDNELLADTLRKTCEKYGEFLRYVREPSPGLSAARHRGATEARGELLSFLDDDIELSETWFSAIQDGFSDPGVGMVGGPSIPKFTDSIPSWFWDFFIKCKYGGWQNHWLSLLDIGKDIEGIDPNYIWGLNFSIRKSVLFECRGFHPDLMPRRFQNWQGDGETGLTMNFKALGFNALYLNDARVFHHVGQERLTVDYFKKRAFFQGMADSFTVIRSGVPPSKFAKPLDSHGLATKLKSKLNNVLKTTTFFNINRFNGARFVLAQAEKAYLDGFRFHQYEAENDLDLYEWIMRENYFDVDISSLSLNK